MSQHTDGFVYSCLSDFTLTTVYTLRAAHSDTRNSAAETEEKGDGHRTSGLVTKAIK